MGFSFFKKREALSDPTQQSTEHHSFTRNDRSQTTHSIKGTRPSLAVISSSYHTTSSSNLRTATAPNQNRYGSTTTSSLSLPLRQSSPLPSLAEKKPSKWKFGIGSRRRSITESIRAPVRERSKNGFEVKSFRTVSRVQEDTLTRPYTLSPTTFSSPPLPAIPLSTPSSPHLSGRIEAGNYRAPSPSPSSMSVEQFRLANVRSHSSISLYTPASPERQERPRFEPNRSGRSSIASSTFAQPLLPPRASFHEGRTSPAHSRSTSATNLSTGKMDMTSSESQVSLSSFKTAQDDSDASPENVAIQTRVRDRTVSVVNLDEELRFIALYGGGDEEAKLPDRLSSRLSTQPPSQSNRTSVYSANKAAPGRGPSHSTPSLALVPASPVTFAPRNPARMSMASNSKFPRAINWNDSSSDEDEDDLPLATLSDNRRASRSSLSLTLPSPSATMGGPTSPLAGNLDLNRRPSADQEILLDGTASSGSSFVQRKTQRNSSAPFVSLSAPSSMEVLRKVSRRSMSTLSLSVHAPPAPSRTHSTPSTNTGITPALPFSNTATNIVVTPLRDQRNSATSSTTSESATSDPQPRTPKDDSPGGSVFGPALPLGTKELDVVNVPLEDDQFSAVAGGWTNPRGEAIALPPPSPNPNVSRMSFSGRSAITSPPSQQRLPQRASQQFNSAAQGNGPMYLPSPSPSPARSMVGLRSKSNPPPTLKSRTAEPKKQTGDVYERMKARHKQEAREAIAIGRDLNGDGLAHYENDEDDEVPLAHIPPRSRTTSFAGSTYDGQQFQQQQHFAQLPASPSFYPTGFNQIPMTSPPGVDPYLYAALPPDQKMSLHFRSQQMLQIMAQASYQAKAESEADWDASSVHGAGAASEDGRRASYGGGMSMPMGFPTGYGFPQRHQRHQHQGYGYGQQQQGPSIPSGRLPPFAPSNSTSQAFYNQQSLYSNPYLSQSFSPEYNSPYQSQQGMSSSVSAMGAPTSNRRASALPTASRRGTSSTIGVGSRY